MKHMFKKSAILMASAITLSLAAPAANTAYAADDLQIAYQHGNAAERIEIEVGKSEDMRFLGAPTNWASLNPTWVSYDPAIASVDDTGVITAKAPGYTVVLVHLSNGMIGTVIVHAYEEMVEPEEVKEPVTLTAAPVAENKMSVVLTNVENPENLTKGNFVVTETYENEYDDYSVAWTVTGVKYNEEKNTLTLTGTDKFVKGFTYTVQYVEGDKVLAENTFVAPQKEKDENEVKLLTILMKNQEAIHVEADATLADGSPIQNMKDVARYAFSFMTSEGETVVPTYDTDKYGIADIAGVDYRAVQSAKAVIVRYVYLKVYLDPNQDGKVTAEEKAEDALGYYLVKVDVDKTLTVEDWSIVH